jgi:hypothetical protein
LRRVVVAAAGLPSSLRAQAFRTARTVSGSSSAATGRDAFAIQSSARVISAGAGGLVLAALNA